MALRCHDTRSVNDPDIGWKSLTNGHPLAAMEDRFDFLITADNSMYARQSLVGRKLRILVLPTNKRSDVLAVTDRLVDVIAGVTIDHNTACLKEPAPLSRPCSRHKQRNHDRTLRSDRRRSPPPDRAEAPRTYRPAGKLHRPHRGGRPRGERHSRPRLCRGPRRRAPCRSSRCPWRSAARAARPADRHQGPGGRRGPAHHPWQLDLPRLRSSRR